MRNWIRCQSSEPYPRLELLGDVQVSGSDRSVEALYGLRIRIQDENNAEDDPDGRSGSLFTIHFRPIGLPSPFLVDAQHLITSLQAPPGTSIILEGLESPGKRFMDLVMISGWRLFLQELAPGRLKYSLYFYSDWELNTIPSLLPGFSQGESSVSAEFGIAVVQSSFSIDISWPFSRTTTLKLKKPLWTGIKWKAPLDISTLGSLLEGTGPLLRQFTFGLIDLRALAGKISGSNVDFIFLESGKDENGFPCIDLVITTPDEVELASFGGFRLLLFGRAALGLRMSFSNDYFIMGFVLKFGSAATEGSPPRTGLRLEGPIIRKIQEAAQSVREVASIIPGNNFNLPEITFEYLFDFVTASSERDLGHVKIPLRPGLPSESHSVLNFLEKLTIPQSAIDSIRGFKLGGLDGGSPAVQLLIQDAQQLPTPGQVGIEFNCMITFVIFNKRIDIQCIWAMALDTQTLAFDPAARLEIRVLNDEIEFAGFKIKGLKSMNAKWDRGGIIFSASNLEAYFVALSESGDTNSGLKFIVDSLTVDSGGMDLQARLDGGSSKIRGIGDVFKGKEGGITITRSKFTGGFIRIEGPLPWMDNATGSIMLAFNENFRLASAQAEFQLGLHYKSDWWVELMLKSINIDLVGETPDLILKITGKITIKPPEGSGETILGFLKSAELEFFEMVLTKSFDRLPPGLALTVALAQPQKVDLLNVFSFEMRSIGIGSGFSPGEASLTVGGQVFFSSNDTKSTDPEFHKFRIGGPEPGKFLPRISLQKLGINFSYKPYLELTGQTEYSDTPAWKGFKGSGTLTINNSVKIAVIMEFSKVLRPKSTDEPEKELRVWMVYAEWRDIDAQLLGDFYLRDVGMGFGWRKTLDVMDNPGRLLGEPSTSTSTVAPHLPTSWKDDLAGEDGRWTVVLSSWLTYNLKKRTEVTPIVGDVMIGLRSDLTFLFSLRGWLFAELDAIKSGGGGAKPSVIGILYYSPPNRHLLAALVVDPGGTPPKGVPPAIVKALIQKPFNFILETKPDLFRLELGFPRQLTFPLGYYTGRAGIMLRKTSGTLVIAVGFEISIDKEISFGLDFFIAKLSIYIKVYIGVYGSIALAIGNNPALYGVVGINALIIISLSLEVNFKLFFVRIRFSLSVHIELALSARVEFGVSGAGFGVAGYASVSLRIWKFGFSASVSFEINGSALRAARERVGISLGSEPVELPKIPLMPRGDLPIPSLPAELERTWQTLYVQRDGKIYVLLLPDKNAWFADPEPLLEGQGEDSKFVTGQGPDYQFSFDTENLTLETTSGTLVSRVISGPSITLDVAVPWNETLRAATPENPAEKVGSIFCEPATVRGHIEVIEHIINSYKPELIRDPRVREPQKKSANEADKRSDVRSPKFAVEDSLYDFVLAKAVQKEKGTELTWQQIALGFTDWPEQMERMTEFDYLFGGGRRGPKPANPVAAQHWRKDVLDKINTLSSTRAGLVSQVLEEFRKWTLGSNLDTMPLLKHCGLAFRFSVVDTAASHRLTIKNIKVVTSIRTEMFDEHHIRNNVLTNEDSGLGFQRDDVDYSIRDVLEFQDEEGIHFSWKLECRDSNNTVFEMDEHLASGVGTEEQLKNFAHFEFFDYFLVERINLSKNETNQQVFTKKVKPGFLPSIVDDDTGQPKFYLIVPRFEFSDIFSSSVNSDNNVGVGDDLIYRFSAVDVFGVPSQVTELITSRKNLAAPPPPKKGTLMYDTTLEKDTISERLQLTIDRGEEVLGWSQDKISFEVWCDVSRILPFGFYGLSDPVTDEKTTNDPIINPEGMQFMARFTTDRLEFDRDSLNKFQYGHAYVFYVRTISAEENASRLIRCEVQATSLRAGHAFKMISQLSVFERVPPPSPFVSSWVSLNELRHQVTGREVPVYSGNIEEPVAYRVSAKASDRELIFKLAHPEWVDDSRIYVTGGYEVLSRDMDATTSDSITLYQRVGDMEVVSEAEYTLNPHDTAQTERWSTEPLGPNETPALFLESSETGTSTVMWGEPMSAALTFDFGYVADGLYMHARMHELTSKLKEACELKKYDMRITGGLPNRQSFDSISFTQLLARFSPETDPLGMNILKWLGRLVEISISSDEGPVPPAEMHDMLTAVLADPEITWKNRYNINLDILLNSDKATVMSFYRLSLHPVIMLMKPKNDKISFDSFKASADTFLQSVFQQGVPGLIAEKTADYIAWVSRFRDRYALTKAGELHITLTTYQEAGSFSRPANPDGSVTLRLVYTEDYARRYAFKIRRVSRYYQFYKRFGLLAEGRSTGDSIFVRLPRVKPPRPPVPVFLGNAWRGDVLCLEWLLQEHEEEAMVQSNETLRNMLGYKGFAWKLLVEVRPGFREASAWTGMDWYARETNPTDGSVAGLSAMEKSILAKGPSWDSSKELSSESGLAGSPFIGLLEPKGTIIRVVKPPYYYQYRLTCFARALDIDSEIKVTDPSTAEPSMMPEIAAARCGWRSRDTNVELWWPVPSVWDSFDAFDREMWKNERPFAERLWDVDIHFCVLMTVNACRIPLLVVKSSPFNQGDMSTTKPRNYDVRAMPDKKYFLLQDDAGKQVIESAITLNPFNPVLNVSVRTTPELQRYLRDDTFEFELQYQRNYGKDRIRHVALSRN